MGGGTVFLEPGIQAEPVRGSAVFWYNLLRDGSSDYRTRHAACPVVAGEKWVSNIWLHERGEEFTRPCLNEMNSDINNIWLLFSTPYTSTLTEPDCILTITWCHLNASLKQRIIKLIVTQLLINLFYKDHQIFRLQWIHQLHPFQVFSFLLPFYRGSQYIQLEL